VKLQTIPSHIIEDPPQILIWEADEIAPSVVIFVVLYMWEMKLFAFLLPFVFLRIMSRIKNTFMRGMLFHLTWRYGILKMNKIYPSGLVSEMMD
jgi:type IV conjugative transfer system protein TraL